MSLCEGCERFREQIFHPDGHGEPYQPVDIKIHDSYTELSACADSVCGLCMFVRRECWYAQMLYVENNFSKYSEHAVHLVFDSASYEITLHLNFGALIEIEHQLVFVPCGATSKTLEFDETREANPSLQYSVDLCNKWLSVCHDQHKQCWPCPPGNDKFLPTRLLDVGTPGQQSIRLVLSDGISDRAEASYVTLSYCWGASNSTACTTIDNLGHRLKPEGIRVESLPQTVQDAIFVTQNLKIKYLWIDALCIIQGNSSESSDWEKELPTMGKVYRHSELTIAASSGSSSSSGFAHRRNAACWPVRNCYLYSNQIDGKPWNVLRLKAKIAQWIWIDRYSPLSSRGWVLQERMLASRTLYWTDDGIFWQCDELNASEYAIASVTQNHYNKFPIRIPEIVEQVKRYQTMEQLSAQTNSCLQGLPQWDLLSAWYTTIEELSKRSFSVESDRIPAITGLGNEIAQACGVNFECGTFKPVPPQTLAWRSDRNRNSGPCVPRRIPGTPSWSWGSTNGRVFFPPRYYWYECVNLARVISLIGPELKISCRLGRLTTIRENDSEYNQWSLKNESNHFFVAFDTTDDEPAEQEKLVKCFILMSRRVDDYSFVCVVFLSAVDEERHVYRRLGWAYIPDQDHFDKDYTEITII